LRAIDSDSVTSLRATAASSVEAGVKVVSGRINVSNAYGTETLPLTLTAALQYWTGSKYAISSTDNVNTMTAAKITRTGCLGALNCSTTPGAISSVTLVSTGVYSIKIGAPGAGNAGSEYLTVNTGGWPSWLPSNSGRAVFGMYNGANQLIYMREAY
jgi:MSHA biogenesis protein MshQ